MTFEANSSLLSASAATQQLLSRSSHFQLVDAYDFSNSPTPSSTAASSARLRRSGSRSQPSVPLSSVAFTLRPPKLATEDCRTLNQAVHSQWLKGRGVAWVSGAPELKFIPERASFEIQLDQPGGAGSPAVTESGLAAALDTLEDAALDQCVAKHLVEGGDDRLHLDAAGRNKYNCPPYPPPPEVILRCSSTCSPPTPDGFAAARALLRKLWSGQTSFAQAMANIRLSLSDVLEVRADYQVILHPSGSDAELIPLTVAMARAKRVGCSRIVTLVAAAGEVGSGTARASGGRHFSAYAPVGIMVQSSAPLREYPASTEVVELKPRGSEGAVRQDYDALFEQTVDRAEAAAAPGQPPYFVLHAVDGSKTGLRLPSRAVLQRLQRRLGPRCLLVLDACQCRSEREEYEWFLRRGACVLVTASKFFAAPGFCGAVLVPPDIAEDCDRLEDVPAGLGDYLTRHEVPPTMRGLRQSLPQEPENYGLLLRWACGIAEMRMFAAMGDRVKEAMRAWVSGVRQLVCNRQPLLELIDTDDRQCHGDVTRAGGCNSVVSIKFLTSCGTRHIDADTLKIMYKHLTNDASGALPSYASEEERRIASVQCLVGQPVKLGTFGVLRLSVSAPLARDVAQTGGLEKALMQDAKVLDKMIVMAKYCESLN